jgi:hypothetical protein
MNKEKKKVDSKGKLEGLFIKHENREFAPYIYLLC